MEEGFSSANITHEFGNIEWFLCLPASNTSRTARKCLRLLPARRTHFGPPKLPFLHGLLVIVTSSADSWEHTCTNDHANLVQFLRNINWVIMENRLAQLFLATSVPKTNQTANAAASINHTALYWMRYGGTGIQEMNSWKAGVISNKTATAWTVISVHGLCWTDSHAATETTCRSPAPWQGEPHL
jgi:hypothetical protein